MIPYLVILCPGNPKMIEGKVEFQDLENDKHESEKRLYLGGWDRLRAALDIQDKFERIIMVGGSSEKVINMKNYLHVGMKKRKMQEKEIIMLISDPDTTGNLWALRKYFQEKSFSEKFSIITNSYHMNRVREFAQKILKEFEADISFIEAEQALVSYPSSESLYSLELGIRKHKEECGIRDWRAGTYNKQDKIDDPVFWKCEILSLNWVL